MYSAIRTRLAFDFFYGPRIATHRVTILEVYVLAFSVGDLGEGFFFGLGHDLNGPDMNLTYKNPMFL